MQKPSSRELKQILLAMSLAGFLCAGWGLVLWWTTEPTPPLGHGASLEAFRLEEARAGERLIRLNDGNPGMMLAAYLFEGEFVSPESYSIASSDWIEFLPLVTTPTSTPPEVEVFIETKDGRDLLGRVRMASVPGLGTPVSGDILSFGVKLNLEAHGGKAGRIVWRVAQLEPEPAAIAGFKYVKARKPSSPSVLLVCSDTHRYDFSLGGLGPELMPNLTKFASNATAYDRAYSASSWTLPSVASLLTGRYPRYHLTGHRILSGVTSELDYDAIPPGNFVAVWGPTYHQLTTYPQQLLSLPQALREAGYTTVLVYANTFLGLSGMCADGFDVVVDATLLSAGSLNYIANSILTSLPSDRPVFLYVHYLDVHEYEKRFQSLMKDPNAPNDKSAYAYLGPPEKVRQAYGETVHELDIEFGKLLDSWDATQGMKDNMVVFYSDHGEHLFDPGHPDINKIMVPEDTKFDITFTMLQVPLLNHGNSMSETLLHVPLVVRYPKSLEVAPGRINRPVSLVDIMPTVLKVVGSDTDISDLDWKSLIPGDESGTAGNPRVLFADYQLYGDEKSSVRREHYKLTLNLTETEKRLWNEADWVLVDTSLPSNGGEGAQQIKDEVIHQDLKGIFGSYAEMSAEATKGISSDHSPDVDETTEQLKRLGYIR